MKLTSITRVLSIASALALTTGTCSLAQTYPSGPSQIIQGPLAVPNGSAGMTSPLPIYTYSVNPSVLSSSGYSDTPPSQYGPWTLPTVTTSGTTVTPTMVYHSSDYSSITLSFPTQFYAGGGILSLTCTTATGTVLNKYLALDGGMFSATSYTGNYLSAAPSNCAGGAAKPYTPGTPYSYTGYTSLVLNNTNGNISGNIDYNTVNPLMINFTGDIVYSLFITSNIATWMANNTYGTLSSHVLVLQPPCYGSLGGPYYGMNSTSVLGTLIGENRCGARFAKTINLTPVNVPGEKARNPKALKGKGELISAPNPTASGVKLSVDNGAKIEDVVIYDSQAREVKIKGLWNGDELNMSTLPAGSYFVKVVTEEGVKSAQIFRQ